MTPLTQWLGFHLALLLLLGLEYLLHLAVPDPRRKAAFAIVLWLVASLACAALLIKPFGTAGATQFLAGYALEQSLSIDNLFVFLLLFRAFNIPAIRQPRVLFFGVLGAILLRGGFILGGVTLLNHFGWVSYILGAFLLVAAIRLLRPEAAEDATTDKPKPRWLEWLSHLSPVSPSLDHFFVRESPAPEPGEPGQPPRRMMTVLLLSLIAVEVTDVLFALDSIPAVLSITRQPFLAYTSNILAVMGMRSLYVLLTAMLQKLRFLHYGLAALLAFAALKMLLARWIEISPLASLGVIAGILGITIAVSLIGRSSE